MKRAIYTILRIIVILYIISSSIFCVAGVATVIEKQDSSYYGMPIVGLLMFILFVFLDRKLKRKLKDIKAEQNTINNSPSLSNTNEISTVYDTNSTDGNLSNATNTIDLGNKYSAFSRPENASLEEIADLAREHSYRMFDMHNADVAGFDPEDIDTSLTDDAPLNSIEKYFLQYLDSREVSNPNIAAYWTYEYNINYKKLITKFILNGYIEISRTLGLSYLKVVELKEILKRYNLPTTGRKKELVKSITENIPLEELQNIDVEPHYSLTEKGHEIIKDLLPSATKNTDLEDKCLQLISQQNFDAAYKEICLFEMSKNIPRGMGMDWEKEYNFGLSKSEIRRYQAICGCMLPNDLVQYEVELKCCAILQIMLGTTSDKIYKTFYRVTKGNYDKAEIIRCLQYFVLEI